MDAGSAFNTRCFDFAEVVGRRGEVTERNPRVEDVLVPSQTGFGFRSKRYVHSSYTLNVC